MAIIKTLTDKNGIEGSYTRISNIEINYDTGYINVEVKIYTDKSYRELEIQEKLDKDTLYKEYLRLTDLKLQSVTDDSIILTGDEIVLVSKSENEILEIELLDRFIDKRCFGLPIVSDIRNIIYDRLSTNVQIYQESEQV